MPDPPAEQQPQFIHVGSTLPLPLPSPLQLKGKTSVNWKRFRAAWDNYKIASRLKTQNKEFRTATLLTCIGQEALDIFDGLAFEDESHKKDIDIVLQKLEEFGIGNKNEIYERYLFNKRDQAADESIDTYVAALRSLAKTCNVCRVIMVVGILDKGIRKKLLQESKLTLQSCIDICPANECTKQQLQKMDQQEEVNALDKKKTPRDDRGNSKRDPPTDKPPKLIKCKLCGKKHEEKKEKCPAWGKTRDKCGAKNHFSVACKQRSSPSRRKPKEKPRDRQRSKVNIVCGDEESDTMITA